MYFPNSKINYSFINFTSCTEFQINKISVSWRMKSFKSFARFQLGIFVFLPTTNISRSGRYSVAWNNEFLTAEGIKKMMNKKCTILKCELLCFWIESNMLNCACCQVFVTNFHFKITADKKKEALQQYKVMRNFII